VRYLRPLGWPPIEKTYTLPPRSRSTIFVEDEDPELANTDVSAVITSPDAIIVERAMYRSGSGLAFSAGHASAGIKSPALKWFLAEGATGPFFDMFILLANPGDSEATVMVDYLLSTGETYTKTYIVPANGRYTIYVDDEEIVGGLPKPLANVAVSSSITSTNGIPIIVERTMWWPSAEMTSSFWTEAHNSPGTTTTGIRWALAEGEVGGADHIETYVLIGNLSAFAGQARISLYFEDGTSAEHLIEVLPRSRTNVNISDTFPVAVDRRFGVVVESLGAVPPEIVVERAIYSSPNGQTWAAGTNSVATRIR
jgi:hypothetical protein